MCVTKSSAVGFSVSDISVHGNDQIHRVRADDLTQVKTTDRALRCNFLFVELYQFRDEEAII